MRTNYMMLVHCPQSLVRIASASPWRSADSLFHVRLLSCALFGEANALLTRLSSLTKRTSHALFTKCCNTPIVDSI